jgi:hypothetical protein
MVIHTEYRGTRYCMGSSDPLPAGFEIWFGGLNFQATGNSYLMLTLKTHSTPITQQAEQSWLHTRREQKTCQSIFPEN